MVRQNWSDDDLAQRLQQRDPEALEALISRYSREVYYFIRLVLDGIGVSQDAEECVNDLFVAIWQEIDTFDPERGTLRTWLTMRAKYIALDRRRQLCRRQRAGRLTSDRKPCGRGRPRCGRPGGRRGRPTRQTREDTRPCSTAVPSSALFAPPASPATGSSMKNVAPLHSLLK